MTTDAPSSPIRRLGAMAYRHRLVVAWGVILLCVAAINGATVLADARRAGRPADVPWVVLTEGSSHLVLAALVPALYWFHRRFPPFPAGRNLLLHALVTVPFSLAHVAAMFLLRWAAAPLLDRAYPLRFGVETLLYEYRKDVLTYLILSTAIVALGRALAAKPAVAPEPAPAAPEDIPTAPLDRFAVRHKGKDVVVAAHDIAWIEAAGNYAILHVGAAHYDIRSSLARLEAELDPACFVRVHKSHIVNVRRVREVEPWISGDSRLKLDDGAVVSLSRRYRPRFEKVLPVRT
jgi:DNA-binding LytR/AlgR family response regulator